MPEERGRFFYIEDLSSDNKKEWWLVHDSKRMVPKLQELGQQLRNRTYAKDLVIPLRVYHGHRPPACLGGIGNHIVNSRIKEVFQRYRCGDARFIPVVVYDIKDQKILSEDYWCVLPDVGAGPPDESAGYYKLITPGAWRKDPTRHDAYGVHFDHSTWTGLDVFELPKSVPLIFTKPVADELLAAKLEGARIGDILDYAIELRNAMAPLSMDAARREGIVVANKESAAKESRPKAHRPGLN